MILPVVALIIGWPTIENSPKPDKKPVFDFVAFILLTIALFTSLTTLNSLEGGSLNWIMLVIFLISLGAFIWHSLHSEKHFLNLRIFKNPFFTFALLAYGLYQFANIGINFVIPNFLEETQGATTFQAGLALLPGTLIGALNNPQVGRLYDRRGAKPGVYWGNVLFIITLVFMIFFTKALTFIPMLIVYAFFNLGRNIPFATLSTNTLDNMPLKDKADANAFFQTTQQFLGAVATTIASLMLSNAPTRTMGVQYFLILLLVCAVLNFGYFKTIFKHQQKQPDANQEA